VKAIRRNQDAGLSDTKRRDPHKPGESPALQGCSDPFRQAREHYVVERVEVEILRASSSDALRMTDLFFAHASTDMHKGSIRI
jgi:hypothetical protein